MFKEPEFFRAVSAAVVCYGTLTLVFNILTSPRIYSLLSYWYIGLIGTGNLAWVSYTPFISPDELCYHDCITIQFDTDASNQSRATQDAYVYETVENAKRSLDRHRIPTLIGQMPLDWTDKSKYAQKSGFACRKYETVTYPVANGQPYMIGILWTSTLGLTGKIVVR